MNPEGRRKKTTLKANPIYYHDLNTESQIYMMISIHLQNRMRKKKLTKSKKTIN